MKKTLYWVLGIILTPFILIILLIIALYLPPIQNWAVHKASAYASESLGMNVSVEHVHLAFPLDLSLEGVRATQQNDSLPQVTDTIADVGRALVNVKLMPLFHSEIAIDAVELQKAKINTADFVHQARVKGYVGRLALTNDDETSNKSQSSDDDDASANTPVADVKLNDSWVTLAKVVMDDAHLNVELSDTVPEDTTKSENKWKIHVDDLAITNSDLCLHMPGDTLQVTAQLADVKANNGYFDLDKGLYELTSLAIAKSAVQYDNNFMTHTRSGLDPNHISLSDISLRIDSLHYLGKDAKGDPMTDLTLKIRQCAMKERSGLELKQLKADIALDTTKVRVNGTMQTPASTLTTRLDMDLNTFDDQNPGRVKAFIDASLGRQDLMMAAQMGGFADMLKILPLHPISIKGEAEGNLREVDIPWLSVDLPTAFSLDARGKARGFMSLASNVFSRNFAANLHADLHTYNLNFVKTFLDKSTAKTINIPSVHALADVAIHGADYDIALKASEGRGNVNAKAKMNLAAMSYDADVKAQGLQLGHFVKGMQLGSFTGTLKANGHGTDIKSTKTRANVHANIGHFAYGKYNLNNVNADAIVQNGRVSASIDSHNKLIDGTIDLEALLNTKSFNGTIATELDNLDLYNLYIVDSPLTLSLCAHVDVSSDFDQNHKVQGLVSDITITDTGKTYRPDDIMLNVLTRKDTTSAEVECGDFLFKAHAHGGYKLLTRRSDLLMAIAKKQFKNRTIDQSELRDVLPRIDVDIHCSNDNPIYRLIKHYGVEYKNIDATMRTSREEGIFADVWIDSLVTQGYRIDTIKLNIGSKSDPNQIYYKGLVKNIQPNEYVFDVYFDGEVMEHGVSLNTQFYDEHHDLGMKLGAEAEMVDSGLRFHLTPEEPIIAYTPFHMNDDNFVLLGRNNKVWADVKLKADDGTGIQIYSTNDEGSDNRLQDLTASVTHLDLAKLLGAIPYAPRMKGMIQGDVHFMQEEDKSFSLASNLEVQDMYYEGCKIGNIGSELVYMPKEDGSHYVDGTLSLDGKEIGSLEGSYNFNTEAINASLEFDKFPMEIVNGFIPEQIIGLEGTAEGTLSVNGTTTLPQVNGELFLQDASLLSVPYGVKMAFDNDPVTITNSKLLFENFEMYDNKHTPITARGSLDFSNTDHIYLDLRMKAEKFLLVDSKETKRSEAYGQAYVNFYCGIKGELDKLNVRGKLEVLPSTNLYYILRDSPITTDNRMKELVTFTDLVAGEPVTVVRPTVDGLNLDMTVTVDNGSHIKAWLNDGHTNFLDIYGEGDLRMRIAGDDMYVTGRYTINEGQMKYSLPVIPLKTFTIEEGSYIEFTGDVMNPKLNITAKEETRASVINSDGVSEIVKFYTGVKITKTLNDMGLEFLIEAPENDDIRDELSMKSAEERGKLAVTMLTTGMYLSDGNTSSFTMNSALSSFLQSEINNIAGSAMKTMDLSFGMDNTTESDGTMHTNYSFKFAKRFWNNRLSISVGGKISTGPDVAGQNKSFFDNVEVQYRFSDTSNQYMNMFYKSSVYDFLEGYVGQYGGGYLYKRKMQYLKELFHPSYGNAEMPAPKPTTDSVQVKNDK